MTRNHQLVYYEAENVGIIGILVYPKRCNNFFEIWLQSRVVAVPRLPMFVFDCRIYAVEPFIENLAYLR